MVSGSWLESISPSPSLSPFLSLFFFLFLFLYMNRIWAEFRILTSQLFYHESSVDVTPFFPNISGGRKEVWSWLDFSFFLFLMFTSFLLPFSLRLKQNYQDVARYFTHAHTMAFPRNLFFWLRKVSSITSLISAFFFFFWDLFQKQIRSVPSPFLSPTPSLFLLITILVLALSSAFQALLIHSCSASHI